MYSTYDELIYGRRVLEEFIRARTRKIKFVWLTEESAKIFAPKLKSEGIGFEIKTKDDLFKLIKHKDHQGVVAKVEPFKYYDISYFFEMRKCLIISLDGVQDVRNFGSIVRTVYLSGADGIIIGEKGSAKVNSVVVHTSAGATEYIPIAMVQSLVHALNILKAKGFTIYGAVIDENSIPFENIEYSFRSVIVFGNEGKGLTGRVKKACDKLIYIPQRGHIDSFNVSVACGIIVYHIAKKIHSGNV